MSSKNLIPMGREIRFIGISVLILFAGICMGLVVILIAFSQELSSDFVQAHGALLRLNQRGTVVFLVAVLAQTAISLLLVYILALRYSHKISGPMYRVRMVLESYLRGTATETVRFRTGDFLMPVADALSGLLARQQADDMMIRKIIDLLTSGAGPDSEQQMEEIRSLVARLQQGGLDDA